MILLDEDVGIKQIKGLYELLKIELDEPGELVIDFSNVRRIDLSVAQLIIAAGRESAANDKPVKLKSIPDDVKYQLHLCGLKL